MSDVLTYRPDPSEFAWTFGGVGPVRTVKPGDILELWTEDAFGGKVRGPDDHVSRVIDPRFLNPQTGPFFVEGAEPGDTLAIHFVSIEPSRDWASSCTVPLFGSLSATTRTALLHDPLPERVWIYEVDRAARTVTYRASESEHTTVLPLDPMHGTVGVAPALFEARSSLVPDAHGGNMDTPEMRAGVTCFLGVNVEGALFSIGDGHCRQGEGETCGVAVEAAMDTVLTIDVIKGRATPWPRLENDTHLMSTGSARPLEDAFRISHADLIAWMVEEHGLEALDAYQLLTQISESPVANVVDPNYTFVTKVKKEYLPRADAYGGVHARLREVVASYRG
ncbi:MAG TPA: acetamidase/formamidase family protein [Actinomycetota bacterium]|nr:acetamidase/formamidase family protein [Actinomycetota bacterium]